MSKKNTDKTIEQIDYELKAKGKLPDDENYPITENSKQKSERKINRSKKNTIKTFNRIHVSKNKGK